MKDGDQNSITSNKFHWQRNFNCHHNDLVCPKLMAEFDLGHQSAIEFALEHKMGH